MEFEWPEYKTAESSEFSEWEIMADQLEELEQHLEMFIEKSRQLGIIASDFQPQGQTALNDKMWVQ